MQKVNVVVIGAGIAGVSAAKKICEDDRFDVKILEASNRIGGRIFTSEIDGIPVDFGATYIHGTEDNVIYELSKKYGLVTGRSDLDIDDDTIDVTNTAVRLSNGESVPIDIVIRCLRKFFELVDDLYTNINTQCMWANMYEDLYAYLVSEYPKRLEDDAVTRAVLNAPYSDSLFEWFLNEQSILEGQEYCKGVSILNDYISLAGGSAVRFSNGYTYGSLVSKLVEGLPKDTISYNQEVVNINTENDPILIKCRNGDQFEADHVIVTASLGVLKRRCLNENLLPNECSLFTPTLPIEKQEALQNLDFGTIGKIVLEFDQEISDNDTIMMMWLPEDKNDAIIQMKFPWVVSLYTLVKLSNVNLYVTWVCGSVVACIESTSKEEIKEGVSYILEKFLKHAVPKPVDIHMHKWLSDPLFGGCYTSDLISGNTSASIAALAEPLNKNRVLFAGEATHIEHYSTVHGAYLTGVREANRLLKTV